MGGEDLGVRREGIFAPSPPSDSPSTFAHLHAFVLLGVSFSEVCSASRLECGMKQDGKAPSGLGHLISIVDDGTIDTCSHASSSYYDDEQETVPSERGAHNSPRAWRSISMVCRDPDSKRLIRTSAAVVSSLELATTAPNSETPACHEASIGSCTSPMETLLGTSL